MLSWVINHPLYSAGIVLVIYGAGIALALGWDKLRLYFAGKDVWWSPWRQLPQEGTYTMYTEGVEPGGPFAVLLSSLSKSGYIQEDNKFRPLRADEEPPEPPPLGIVWVGFFRREYKRKRTQQRLIGEKVAEEDRSDKAEFFFQSQEAVKVEGAETLDKIGVNVVASLMVRVLDPVLANFGTGKPEIQARNAGSAAIIRYAAEKSFEGFLEDLKDKDNNPLSSAIIGANDGGEKLGEGPNPSIGGLRERFGIVLYSPYLASVELSDKEYQRAVEAKARAEAEGKAELAAADYRVKVAEKDAEATRKEAAGKADAERAIGSATADADRMIAAANAGDPAAAMASAIRRNPTATTLVINAGNSSTPVAVPLPAAPEPAPRRITVYDATGKPVKPTAEPAVSGNP
jgi:regulator of protease activity HflC (stomatin/prohibitin superfamily)